MKLVDYRYTREIKITPLILNNRNIMFSSNDIFSLFPKLKSDLSFSPLMQQQSLCSSCSKQRSAEREYFFSFFSISNSIKLYVSDDECPRYRFSCSSQHITFRYILSCLFAHIVFRAFSLHVLFFKEECYLRYHSSFLSLSCGWMCLDTRVFAFCWKCDSFFDLGIHWSSCSFSHHSWFSSSP
jgi:hypothetical protein